MTQRHITISPLAYARIGGVLYLINIACGLFGEAYARGTLVVAGDAAATAQHLMSHEFLFRWGVLGDLIMHITDVPLTIIFYVLLRPVSRDLSLLAALFGMLQTAVLCANKLTLVLVLLLLGGPGYMKAFNPEQLRALALLSLNMHESGFGVGLIFFGVSCFVTAYLLYQSGYFPKALGILQAMAGVCYLVNSLAMLLNPALADKLVPGILLPAFVGELGTALWLVVKGLDTAKWEVRIRLGPVIVGPDGQ
jgi:hypothetical protein